MKHFAMTCPEVPGHLNPMLTLGAALAACGPHRVSFVGRPDGAAMVRSRGIEFFEIGADLFPVGTMPQEARRLGRLRGFRATRFTRDLIVRGAQATLRDLGAVLRRERIDGLLEDQVSSAGGAVAEACGLPHVTVANALAINHDDNLPPVVCNWAFRDAAWARARNRLAHRASHVFLQPLLRMIEDYRRQAGLAVWADPEERHSALAQITQQPSFFDFPRRRQIPGLHYTGPFHAAGRDRDVDFPWSALDGRPVVYASMGTLQNGNPEVFRRIAAACAPLDVQLVLSLGGGGQAPTEPLAGPPGQPLAGPPGQPLAGLPGQPLVVPYAPQLAVLSRASLAITHAGLNTALEALAQGVPMVAVPVTNDQPGVARRVEFVGAGVRLPLRALTVPRLRRALRKLLENPAYRTRAQACAAMIAAEAGLHRAAVLADQALTGQPYGLPSQ